LGGEQGHDELLEELGRVLGEEGLQGLAEQLKVALLFQQLIKDEKGLDTAVMAAFGPAWSGAGR
jgi:hypothetical protein